MRMHLKALAVAAVIALTAGSAARADEPFNWTGFYMGAHAGGPTDASTVYTYTVAGNFEPAGRPRPTEPDGYLFGVQTGYLWQLGPAVFGIEGSGSYPAMRGTLKENPPPAGNDYQTHTDVSAILIAAGRLGLAWDRLLLYGKAGYGWSRFNFDASFFNRDGPGGTNGSQVRINHTFDASAPVYGAGIEYALGPHVILGVEYLRMDFGTSDVVTLNTVNSGILTEKLKASHEIDTLSARLNFKF
jgi:outer membrane immunogenic protein